MNKKNKDYSIMVFPSLEEKPIQFRITQSLLRYFFVGMIVVISTAFIFINNFVEYSRQAEAYEALLIENKELSEQVLEFVEKTEYLYETIENLEIFDASIRVMLERQDVSIDEKEIARQISLNTTNEVQVAEGGSEVSLRNYTTSSLGSRNVLDRTINELNSNLEKLTESANEKSESLSELEGDVQNYTEKLEATPSTWPARGIITSNFGYRRSPFGSGYDFHNGIDIGVSYNTAVYAPASGKVVERSYTYGYGYYIVIDHGKGYTTLFAHLNSFRVQKGDTVSRGDLIAYSGSSGRSTGPHLHYEVRVNGVRVNPRNYLP
jgi:murein DD-endopeptidase MepM/ murein hydrolase activator NlpD